MNIFDVNGDSLVTKLPVSLTATVSARSGEKLRSDNSATHQSMPDRDKVRFIKLFMDDQDAHPQEIHSLWNRHLACG